MALIMRENPAKSCKRVRFSSELLIGHVTMDEDDYYGMMIMKFLEEKRQKFAREDALAARREKRKLAKRATKEKKRSERPIRLPIVSNEVTQRLKEYITDEMNGKEVKMVIQKPLFSSDLKTSQNRLSMPINQLKTEEFLTKDEKQHLDAKLEFEVKLLGPRLKMHSRPMVMKKWHMEKSDNYVLKTNWNDFVRENKKDLKEKSMIQVWSFRKDEKLHFAIACLENDVDGQTDASASPVVKVVEGFED